MRYLRKQQRRQGWLVVDSVRLLLSTTTTGTTKTTMCWKNIGATVSTTTQRRGISGGVRATQQQVQQQQQHQVNQQNHNHNQFETYVRGNRARVLPSTAQLTAAQNTNPMMYRQLVRKLFPGLPLSKPGERQTIALEDFMKEFQVLHVHNSRENAPGGGGGGRGRKERPADVVVMSKSAKMLGVRRKVDKFFMDELDESSMSSSSSSSSSSISNSNLSPPTASSPSRSPTLSFFATLSPDLCLKLFFL